MAFVDDPAVAELNDAVMELERAINFADYVDPVWRARWKEFVKRWRAELVAYEELGDELDPTEGRKRLDKYGAAFQVFDAHWESGVPQGRGKGDNLGTTDDVPPVPTSSSGLGAVVLIGLLLLAASR